jgi:hypothetical protein
VVQQLPLADVLGPPSELGGARLHAGPRGLPHKIVHPLVCGGQGGGARVLHRVVPHTEPAGPAQGPHDGRGIVSWRGQSHSPMKGAGRGRQGGGGRGGVVEQTTAGTQRFVMHMHKGAAPGRARGPNPRPTRDGGPHTEGFTAEAKGTGQRTLPTGRRPQGDPHAAITTPSTQYTMHPGTPDEGSLQDKGAPGGRRGRPAGTSQHKPCLPLKRTSAGSAREATNLGTRCTGAWRPCCPDLY